MKRLAAIGTAIVLAACKPAPEASLEVVPLSGADIYAMNCSVCHQQDGGGVPGNCPPFQNSPRLAGPSEELIRIVLQGRRGVVERHGETYKGIMPAWRDQLGDEQVAAVLNYILETWHPAAPRVDAKDVSAVRNATASAPLLPQDG